MSKLWKDLRFTKEIVIKAQDEGKPVHVEFKEDDEWEFREYPLTPIQTARERSIRLLGNAMYMVRYDYPEDFKKLLAATGDANEAYRLYKALQKDAPDNWEDYSDEGSVWQ